jgi:hypothetical protein
MYFIPRNNKIYNYIAHTSLPRLYGATFLCIVLWCSAVFYCLYNPLLSHIVLLKAEINALHKKCDDICQLDKSNSELSPMVESYKKNIIEHAIIADARQEHCYKRMLFILDTITKENLKLLGYGSCTEKDKSWYAKDAAHFEATGALPKIISFLAALKNARTMISIDQIALSRTVDDTFQVGFDVELITVKK